MNKTNNRYKFGGTSYRDKKIVEQNNFMNEFLDRKHISTDIDNTNYIHVTPNFQPGYIHIIN